MEPPGSRIRCRDDRIIVEVEEAQDWKEMSGSRDAERSKEETSLLGLLLVVVSLLIHRPVVQLRAPETIIPFVIPFPADHECRDSRIDSTRGKEYLHPLKRRL